MTQEPFQYIKDAKKRNVMKDLLHYAKTSIQHFKEIMTKEFPPIENLKEDQLASLWFNVYIHDDLENDVGTSLDGRYSSYIENFGIHDALRLLDRQDQNPSFWFILHILIRYSWECRYKKKESDRRKKVEDLTPELHAYHERLDNELLQEDE